jgi:hypothetical protein
MHCNQLLGIARRKAGTMVTCPSCSAQVVVPETDESPHIVHEPAEQLTHKPGDSPIPPAPAPSPPVFERSDFEEVFRPVEPKDLEVSLPMGPPSPAPVPSPERNGPEPQVSVERVAVPGGFLDEMPPRPGLWLSAAVATWLSVVVVILLTLAFTAGLAVGMFLRAPE